MFELTSAQTAIGEAVGRICAKYDDAYWLARDNDHRFPEEFVRDIAAGGYLGHCDAGERRAARGSA